MFWEMNLNLVNLYQYNYLNELILAGNANIYGVLES